MSNVGYATLTIIPSAKGFGEALAKDTTAPLTSQGTKGGQALGGGILGAAKGALAPIAGVMAGVFATGAIVGWGKEQVASLARIESINAQTASAIKATGGAAGVTAQHVEDLAGSLENMTGTEAESVQQGANLLLTFKNIKNGVGEGNDIFDQTTSTLVDMARAMGQDPQSAAIQLGKALNDPIAGISALSRVGVTFSDDQKKVIQSLVDSGDVMGAQKIILAELNSEFGGAGAAYAETYAGKVTLLGHAWGTFGEQIFSAAMPALGAVVGGLTGLLNNVLTPGVAAVQGFASDFVDGFRNGTDAIDANQSVAASWGAAFFGVLSQIGGAVGPVLGQIGAALGPVLSEVASAFGPVLQQIGPLAGEFLKLWTTVSPASILLKALLPILPQIASVAGQLATVIGGALGQAAQALAPVLASLAQTLSGVMSQALVTLTPIVGQIASALGGAFMGVVQALVPIVTLAAKVFVQVLDAVLPLVPVVLSLVQPLLSLLTPILALIAPLIQLVGAILQPLIGLFTALLTPIIGLIQPLVGLLVPVLQVLVQVLGFVVSIIASVLTWLVQLVTGTGDAGTQLGVFLTNTGGMFADFFTNTIGMFADFFTNTFGMVSDFVTNTVGMFSDFVNNTIGMFSDFFGKVGAFVTGLVSTWTSGWNSIVSFVGQAWQNIVTGVQTGIANVVGFFSGLLGQITSTLSGIGTWLLQTGKDLIGGLVQGIKNAGDQIWSTLKKLVNDAIGGVKDLLGIHSPSRVFRSFGEFTGEGFALGIESMAGRVQDAADSMVPSLPTVAAPDIEGGGLSGQLASAGIGGTYVDFDYVQNGGEGLTSEQELTRAARRLKQSLRK